MQKLIFHLAVRAARGLLLCLLVISALLVPASLYMWYRSHRTIDGMTWHTEGKRWRAASMYGRIFMYDDECLLQDLISAENLDMLTKAGARVTTGTELEQLANLKQYRGWQGSGRLFDGKAYYIFEDDVLVARVEHDDWTAPVPARLRPGASWHSSSWDGVSIQDGWNDSIFKRIGIEWRQENAFPAELPRSTFWLRVRWPFIAAVAAIGPVVQVVAALRARRRVQVGCCHKCGYDLRATPQRCPECGTPARAPLS